MADTYRLRLNVHFLTFVSFCSCRSDTALVRIWDWTSATESAHDGCHRPHEAALFHQRCPCGSPTHLWSAGHQHAAGSKSKLPPFQSHLSGNLNIAQITSTTCQTLAPPTPWPHPPTSVLITQSFTLAVSIILRVLNLLLWHLSLAPNLELPKVCGWGAWLAPGQWTVALACVFTLLLLPTTHVKWLYSLLSDTDRHNCNWLKRRFAESAKLKVTLFPY